MKIKIALVVGLNLVLGLNVAQADDLFWYLWPSPTAYLYVADPVLYRLWDVTYGHRQAYVSTRYPVYRPPVLIHDRSRFRRRACEIRILSSFH